MTSRDINVLFRLWPELCTYSQIATFRGDNIFAQMLHERLMFELLINKCLIFVEKI